LPPEPPKPEPIESVINQGEFPTLVDQGEEVPPGGRRSLLSSCTFRLRRKVGSKWERASIIAEPRSAYLLAGPSRTEWHSIRAVDSLRYSITFRNFKKH
jgi:hypothetical protein